MNPNSVSITSTRSNPEIGSLGSNENSTLTSTSISSTPSTPLTSSMTHTPVSGSDKMSATLRRKLNKFLETNLENEDFLTSLNTLSTIYGSNSLSNRRNLRGNLDQKLLSTSLQFLSAFHLLHQDLELVDHDIKELRNLCEDMQKKLQSTTELAGSLMQTAATLQKAKERNSKKLEIAESFLEKFQISQSELNRLRSTVPLDEKFFETLNKIQKIQTQCKLLLRTQHQSAGLEIMDVMALHQQTAYDKLYRWVKTECRNLESETPELHPSLKTAFKALSNRSVLLSCCLDEVEATRNRAILRSFIRALTQGGPNGIPRPIELQAHDPLRYVGDMLAWIHHSLASEYDLLYTLLFNDDSYSDTDRDESSQKKSTNSDQFDEKLSSEDEKNTHTSNSNDVTNSIKKVLAGSFEGICRPFKVRFEQVLLGDMAGLVTIWKLANLLDFYVQSTLSRHLTSDSPLSICFIECKEMGMKRFYHLLKESGDELLHHPPGPPISLSPPHAVHEAMNRLVDIMASYDSSIISNESREQQFSPVLTAILDPLLQMCTLSATQLPAADMAVYMINCLSVIQNAILPYNFAGKRVEMLSAQIEAHMDTLVEEETSSILLNCGLAEKLSILKYRETDGPLSQVHGMDHRSLIPPLRSFESSVFETGTLVMNQCDRVIQESLRTSAKNSVTTLIASAYATLYYAIMDPSNQYDSPLTILHYNPEQFGLLLGLNNPGSFRSRT